MITVLIDASSKALATRFNHCDNPEVGKQKLSERGSVSDIQPGLAVRNASLPPGFIKKKRMSEEVNVDV